MERHERLESAPDVLPLLDAMIEPVFLLDENRQILLSNAAGLRMAGEDQRGILGKRPGEALNCAHWTEAPSGCGTGRHCSLCGALKAILDSQRYGRPALEPCRLSVRTARGDEALDLEVAVTPASLASVSVGICAIRDVSSERRREFLEHAFYHDALEAVGNLRGLIEIWSDLPPEEGRAVQEMALAIASLALEEIRLGGELSAAERGDLRPCPRAERASDILSRLTSLYARHPLAEGRRMMIQGAGDEIETATDPGLLQRVLGNLLKNALEATQAGGTVTLSVSREPEGPAFHIHNEGAIAADHQPQVFQRGFTTKLGLGRGTGAYSAKLLTERYLGGKLSFASATAEGTTFTVQLPDSLEPACADEEFPRFSECHSPTGQPR